jgi:hypothetical protein
MTGRQATLVAAVAGLVLWFGASLITGRREAWDAGIYWSLFYPLALAASGLLGYFHPQRAWRWPFILFGFEFVAMCIRNGELGSLWPLGLVLFAGLALPGVVVARLGARLDDGGSSAMRRR